MHARALFGRCENDGIESGELRSADVVFVTKKKSIRHWDLSQHGPNALLLIKFSHSLLVLQYVTFGFENLESDHCTILPFCELGDVMGDVGIEGDRSTCLGKEGGILYMELPAFRFLFRGYCVA